MTTAATAQQKLIRMVSLSTTFRGGETADQAKARIHTGNVNKYVEGNTHARPYAVINQNDQTNRVPIAGGVTQHYVENGSLFLHMTRDVPQNLIDEQHDIDSEMTAWFDGVLEDVMDLSDQDDAESTDGYGHLHIRSAPRVDIAETDRKLWTTLGRFYYATYDVQWGYED